MKLLMISQSTKVEDLLGKNIITKDKNKNIKSYFK